MLIRKGCVRNDIPFCCKGDFKVLKQKRIVIVLFLLVAVLLSPACYVLADDTVEQEGTYNADVPFLQGIGVELERNDHSGNFFIISNEEKHRSISNIVFKFDHLDDVDYRDYELVFDFKLKSLLEDGTITTHDCSYVCNIGEENKPGFFDSLLISLTVKDDYFKQKFSYVEIIKNSQDCQSKLADSYSISAGMGNYAHNTVISQADCYLREKTTGNYGLISRFSFAWDENFWNQLCNKITYKLIVPGTEIILNSEATQNSLFAGNLSSEGVSWLQEALSIISMLGEFIVNVPKMLYVIFSNLGDVSNNLVELMKAVFPFVPSIIFDVFGVLITFIFLVALFKLVGNLISKLGDKIK